MSHLTQLDFCIVLGANLVVGLGIGYVVGFGAGVWRVISQLGSAVKLDPKLRAEVERRLAE